ncbi:MAG: flagellar biosynthesis protein FlhA [Spirochaetia bacterium]|nr:flagellar biosynthesis protein FlhA [Spirochaetia bacterium]
MKDWYKQTDIMLGIGVVAVIAMLVIPMPSMLLDLLLTLSIMISLVTLLTAMFSQKNTDFSVFPSLLLVTTVFRLALNVSTTRLILMKGPAFDGKLIRAFGEFVVGGQYVIGFIIFLILVLVQMIVITKGATRISEVAARFTLDALPGKQMSIDSDLSAGILSEEEARKKRDELRKEVDFYGQMDGATKFVQGDVRVGLIITAINIIGGLIIGVAMRNETWDNALKIYTLLTVGDGLVAQIPSLLITTATGMVVTRAGSEKDLASDLTGQLFSNPRVLWVVAGTMLVSVFIPGFPIVSPLLIGAFIGFLAFIIMRNAKKEGELSEQKGKEQKSAPSAERFLDEIAVDPLKLEIGYNLIPMVDPAKGGSLLERITNLRQKFAREMGMVIPPIRINDNMDLEGNDYSILVGGIEVAHASAYPDKIVALDSGNVRQEIEGDPYKDPAYNLSAVLIPPEKKSEAEEKGYLAVDATNIIVTHMSEILRNYATQIMGREEVKMLLDKTKQKYPAVVEEISANLNRGIVQHVLHNLLKENVSIKNLVAIFETMADNAEKTKDPVLLTEMVRQRLGRQVVNQYADKNKLKIIQIDPMIENEMRASLSYDEREGRIIALDPHLQVQFRDAFINAFNDVNSKGNFPVFLTSAEIRTGIFSLLERELNTRTFAVIAFEELPSDIDIEVSGHAILKDKEEMNIQ